MPTSDTTARDALERWISVQLLACSHDELRVIAIRIERMAKARAKYGPLDLATDARDFRREAAEEGIDRGFYVDALYVKRQDEERERLRCEAADEIAAATAPHVRTSPVELGLAELRDAPAIGRAPVVDFVFHMVDEDRG